MGARRERPPVRPRAAPIGLGLLSRTPWPSHRPTYGNLTMGEWLTAASIPQRWTVADELVIDIRIIGSDLAAQNTDKVTQAVQRQTSAVKTHAETASRAAQREQRYLQQQVAGFRQTPGMASWASHRAVSGRLAGATDFGDRPVKGWGFRDSNQGCSDTLLIAIGLVVLAPVQPAQAAGSISTRITASVSTSVYGTSGSMFVRVIGSTAAATSGRVRVYSGTSPVGEAVFTNGSVRISLARTVTPGTRSLTVQYFGSTTHGPSKLTGVRWTVLRANPTMTASARAVTYPGRATIYMTLRGPLAIPSGRVFVSRGTQTLGVRALATGAATFALPQYAPGVYMFRLFYTGDYRFAAKTINLNVRISPPGGGQPPRPANRNCTDFSTQAQAQSFFDYYYPYYGDFSNLDSDHDMVACESLP